MSSSSRQTRRDAVSRGATSQPTGELRILADTTCLACGCLCDDIILTVDIAEDRVITAANACELGKSRFLVPISSEGPEAFVNGQPATYTAAITRAAEVLVAADYPLIEGMSQSTSEAQRWGVAIADRIGGCLDSATSREHGPTVQAMQTVGEVTCTLGELRHRADFLMYWGCDPVSTHPRHFERYSLDAQSERFPQGRQDRFAVLIDEIPRHGEGANATAQEMNQVLSVKSGANFELAWVLRALAKGVSLDAADVLQQTGLSLDIVQPLFERMKSAHYGAIVFGSDITADPAGKLTAMALLSLARDMNRHTRFVVSPLRGGGNVSGGDNVFTWSTGYPFGVQLSKGYPRYSPGEFTTKELLSRRETDAALLVGMESIGQFGESAREHLLRIPFIAIGPHANGAASEAAVAIRTATPGLQSAGVVYRADEITLPLRPALRSTAPSESQVLQDVLRQLESKLQADLVSSRAFQNQ